jgi:hypothetical protein
VANESFPGPGPEHDPTTYWIRRIQQQLLSESAAFAEPVGPQLPPRVLDPEHQVALTLEETYSDEEIIRVVYHPGGDCTINTRAIDKLGPVDTILTFRLYGPPPRIGEKARLYRSETRLPRGLVFPGDEASGKDEQVQFYQTEQEYETSLRERNERLAGITHDEEYAMQERLDQLPETVKARLEVIMITTGRGKLPEFVLQAEQAVTLATNIPDPDRLTALKRRGLPALLATLSTYMNVDGWDQRLANEVCDLAIFYLETRDSNT